MRGGTDPALAGEIRAGTDDTRPRTGGRKNHPGAGDIAAKTFPLAAEVCRASTERADAMQAQVSSDARTAR